MGRGSHKNGGGMSRIAAIAVALLLLTIFLASAQAPRPQNSQDSHAPKEALPSSIHDLYTSLEILNPVEYPSPGDIWEVRLNTSGTADLTINSPNARWAQYPGDDRKPRS